MTADAALEGRLVAPTAEEGKPQWKDRTTVAAIALLVLHAALAWLNRVVVPGITHDEAHYMLLARSVRDFRYEDFFLLGSPVHSQYPPGVAAFFALLSLPFGDHPDLLIAAVVLCSVGALAVLFTMVRKLTGPGVALVMLSLCAVNPELLLFAGHPLSEPVYMLFAMLALWAAMAEPAASADVHGSGWRLPWRAVLAALAAAMTRMVGVTVVGALFVHWILDRRFRRAIGLAVVGSIMIGSWLVWSAVAPAKLPGRSYIVDATLSRHGTQQRPLSLAGTLVQRVTANVPAYATQHLPKDLPQPTLVSIGKRVNATPASMRVMATVDTVVALCLVLLVTIGSVSLWKRARVVVCYLVLYLALLAVWPFHLSRFLLPLVPIVIWVLMEGALLIAAKARWMRPLPYVLAVGIVGIALARNLTVLRETLPCDRSQPRTSAACMGEPERGFLSAMDFVRDSTPDTTVFMTSADTQLGYMSGRRAFFAPGVAQRDPTTLLAGLRSIGVEYILLTPIRPPREQLVTILQEQCSGLEVAREFTAITLILRIAPARLTPERSACAAIERYVRADFRSPQW